MYKNKTERKYHIFDCIKNEYIASYDGLEKLIEGIAIKYNHTCWYNDRVGNCLLDEYNCTMCDTINHMEVAGGQQTLRRYVVFDDLFRIIDVRMYRKKILSYGCHFRPRKYKPHSKAAYDEKTKPEFRRGPVRGTGGRYGHYYRHPKTFAEIRNNSIPEYKQFVRKSRIELPTVWDDLVRNQSRCWKDQGKKRKQWM